MPIGKNFKAMAFLFLVVLGGTQLSAQIIYVSNIANGSDYGAQINNNLWLAEPFTTGTSPMGYTLDSTRLMIGAIGTPPAYSVSLYTDASTAPGTSVSSLTTSDIPNGTLNATLSFTPASATSLAPLTTYWLVISSTAASSSSNYVYAPFNYTSSSYSSSDGWAIPTSKMLSSTDSGGSWTSFGSYALFSVTATAVPEPSTYLLVGLGLAALLFVRARCRV